MREGQSLPLEANYNGVKQSGQQITTAMREALYDSVCKTAGRLVPGGSAEPKDAGVLGDAGAGRLSPGSI